ncbi:hypothetical protein Tco_1103784 [Tanacetum coccineum]
MPIQRPHFERDTGHFVDESTVMRFGLTNAPVSKEEHEVHLKLVLESLRKEKLKEESEIKTCKRNELASPKWGVQLSRRTRRKATMFRSIDGKEKEMTVVLYGSNLGYIGGSVQWMRPCIKDLVQSVADKTYYNPGDMYWKEWNSGGDQLRLRWMIYLVVLADAAESVRDAIGFEYCLASSSGWTK